LDHEIPLPHMLLFIQRPGRSGVLSAKFVCKPTKLQLTILSAKIPNDQLTSFVAYYGNKTRTIVSSNCFAPNNEAQG
jgi:hypothetical protein